MRPEAGGDSQVLLPLRSSPKINKIKQVCVTADLLFVPERKIYGKSCDHRLRWGELECELKMKEVAGMSSRCIPFAQEKLGDKCACCGKPAEKMVYWDIVY